MSTSLEDGTRMKLRDAEKPLATVKLQNVAVRNRSRATARKPRRLLVRIHRWLSLVLGLWIALMAVTGCILLIDDEIIAWTHPELFRASAGDLGVQAAVDTAAAAYPGWVPEGVSLPVNYRGVYVVGLRRGEGEDRAYRAVFVNPGWGSVNGERNPEGGFVGTTARLHRELLLTKVLWWDAADFVAWLGVGWLITLLTGLVVWCWPRPKRLAHVLRVRRRRGTFAFHFDLHKSVGIVTVIPLVVIVATGISLERWEFLRRAGADPASTSEGTYRSEQAGLTSTPTGEDPLTLDEARQRFEAAFPDGQVTSMGLPIDTERDPISAWISSGWDPNKGRDGSAGNVLMYIDQFSGETLHVADPADFPLTTQLFETWTFPVHVGSFGGVPTQLLWLGIAASPLLMVLSGVQMWRVRRNRTRR